MSKRILISLLLSILFQKGDTQNYDYGKAQLIDSVIAGLEQILSSANFRIKDTIIYGTEDVTKLPDTLKISTQYFSINGEIAKMIRQSKYNNWTYYETIYVQDKRPIKYHRQEYYKDTRKSDFDIYFQNDKAVYQLERVGFGKPYPPAFLGDCYQILKGQ